jgi:predicted nucleotidyltransferase
MQGMDELIAQVRAELEADPQTAGVLLFGSVASGRTHAESDVDLFCLTTGDWYQKEIRELGGREVEIQWMPETRVRESFSEVSGTNHNFMLNIFTSGKILFDREGRLAALIEEAQRTREKGPSEISRMEVAMGRVLFRHKLAEIRRQLREDPGLARTSMTFFFYNCLYAFCRTHRLWSSKVAHLLRALEQQAPAFHAQARAFLDATTDEARLAAIQVMADLAMEPVGWGEERTLRMPRMPANSKGRLRAGLITW